MKPRIGGAHRTCRDREAAAAFPRLKAEIWSRARRYRYDWTRSPFVTDDGEMLLGDARRLLQLEEAARQRLAAPRLSGTVRLGVVEEVAGTASARSRRRRRDAPVPYQPRLRFAPDSPVEGDGFELPVPREKKSRNLTGGSKQQTRLEQARTASVYLLKQDVVKASSLR